MLQQLNKSESFSRLLEATDTQESDKELYRLFCYGFRSGGFVDVAKSRIESILTQNLDTEVRNHLEQAIGGSGQGLTAMLELRAIPGFSNESIEGTFQTYTESVDHVLKNLEDAKEKYQGKENPIVPIYAGFRQAMERVTNGNGLWVMNYEDPLLKDHGVIYIKDQDLYISQIVFTNLGLHVARVGPEKSFLHAHVGGRKDNAQVADSSVKGLSELHVAMFGGQGKIRHYLGEVVEPGQEKADVNAFDAREEDVIEIEPGRAHGGLNLSETEYAAIVFAAGGAGPWRGNYDDRQPLKVGSENMVYGVGHVNGALLSYAYMSDKPICHVILPYQFTGVNGYGVGLDLIHVGIDGISLNEGFDNAIAVWRGSGRVEISGTNIRHDLKSGDFFQVPAGIPYSVIGNKGKIACLKFAMHQG